ncbi:MAG: hypothetical protein JW861_10565 [Bacteroidales bacterium]|nr:hypothetical protein [Bacteroidales bacterium]
MYIFQSRIENPEKLEMTLTGRKVLADAIEKMIIDSVKTGKLYQNLIVGPRGSGKTHLLRVLYNRFTDNPEVMNHYEIAYMVEDEVGLASFVDFMNRVFAALQRWDRDKERLQSLERELDLLKSSPAQNWNEMACSILLRFLEKKRLLILIENLNQVFHDLRREGQAKLRDFIQTNGNVSFIATSQALFHDLRREDMPFMNFFSITHLKNLTLEETVRLMMALAKAEGYPELEEYLGTDEARDKIRAIHDFTRGNHRLVVLFFDFLRAEYKSELSGSFLKSIDKLKPYYESLLKSLSPMQQKIIQYLSLSRTPQSGNSISYNCFIEQRSLSKQLSELQKLGYINAFKRGRERYYEVTEPLMRFYYEIGESQEAIIPVFIDFLVIFYRYLARKDLFRETDIRYPKGPFTGSADPDKPDISEDIGIEYENYRKRPDGLRADIENKTDDEAKCQDLDSLIGHEIKVGNYPQVLIHIRENLVYLKNEECRILFSHSLATVLEEIPVGIVDDYIVQLTGVLQEDEDPAGIYGVFTLAVLSLLRLSHRIETIRFIRIRDIFNKLFVERQEAHLLLKYLDVGIRYLKLNEKDAIFDLSKEERNLFGQVIPLHLDETGDMHP